MAQEAPLQGHRWLGTRDGEAERLCRQRFADTMCVHGNQSEAGVLPGRYAIRGGSKLSRPTASTGKVVLEASCRTSGRGGAFLHEIFTLLRTPRATILVRALSAFQRFL